MARITTTDLALLIAGQADQIAALTAALAASSHATASPTASVPTAASEAVAERTYFTKAEIDAGTGGFPCGVSKDCSKVLRRAESAASHSSKAEYWHTASR